MDQFTGVGVGLADGVAAAVGVGVGFCVAFRRVFDFSAFTASAPNVIAVPASVATANNKPR